MVRARAMTAALDSGLIALLAEEPATAAQLSEQLALDPAGIAVILRVLTEDGVVTVRGAEFRLAPSTQAAALDEGLAPVLGFMGDQWEILSDLDEQLERPRDIHGRELPPDFWQRYQAALAANAGETPAELAAALGADSSERVLDVGGGHGLFGSACRPFRLPSRCSTCPWPSPWPRPGPAGARGATRPGPRRRTC